MPLQLRLIWARIFIAFIHKYQTVLNGSECRDFSYVTFPSYWTMVLLFDLNITGNQFQMDHLDSLQLG